MEEEAGSSSTGVCASGFGSGADAASISGFSIDTGACCSCDGSTWEAERFSARIFNPLVRGVNALSSL